MSTHSSVSTVVTPPSDLASAEAAVDGDVALASRWARAVAGDGGAWRELLSAFAYLAYAWFHRTRPEDANVQYACFYAYWNARLPNSEESGAGRFREWMRERLADWTPETAAALVESDSNDEWASALYANEPPGTAENLFERRWTLTLLDWSIETLREEYNARGETEHFTEFLPFAADHEDEDDSRYVAAAGRLGASMGAARRAVFDFRSRHRTILRAFVADTITDSADIDLELTNLLCACIAGEPGSALPESLAALPPDQLVARALRSVQMSVHGSRWQPPSNDEVVRLFPRYEMLGLLGHGGMGAVYKARQIELDRFVAIKLLPLEVSIAKDFEERFVREARALARISHPNIITVHEFGRTHEGHLFFVMEFIAGQSLHQRIQGAGLEPAEALALLEQVLIALACAHGKGVIHRDIKPANVLLTPEGHVKVADFGLARLNDAFESSDHHTMTGIVMGTPDYMAPEQWRGKNVDARSDLYSVGVMLYEMLCGETPKGAFDLPSVRIGCDPRIDEIIRRVLQQDPVRRYQTAEEMLEAVSAARKPVSVVLPPRVQPTPVGKGRSRMVAMGAFSIAGLCVFVFVGYRISRPVSRNSTPPTVSDSSTPKETMTLPVASPALATPFPVSDNNAEKAAFSKSAVSYLTDPAYEWSPPVSLDAPINSIHDERHPSLSSDELVLVYSRNSLETHSLMEAQRASTSIPFDRPKVIFTTHARVPLDPYLSPDGLTLLYNEPAGGDRTERADLFRLTRASRGDPWQFPATNMGRSVNTDANELSPWLSPDGLLLLFTSNRAGSRGGGDIFRARRSAIDAPFSEPENLGREINTALNELTPCGTSDPNTILFAREGQEKRLRIATKSASGTYFVRDLGIPLEGNMTAPWLCADGRTLYFAAYAAEGLGWYDIMRTQRVPKALQRAAITSTPFASAPVVPIPQTNHPNADQKPYVNSLGMRFMLVPILFGKTKGQAVQFSVWETRVQDYQTFANATGREWRRPDFAQTPLHPAVYVSHDDANAFCDWLTEREHSTQRLAPGQKYRLPSSDEWLCAAGLLSPMSNSPEFAWGADWPPPAGAGNLAGTELNTPSRQIDGYRDPFVTTAPVGSFPANAFGLYDLAGNVWEWCADWHVPAYDTRISRGGSYLTSERIAAQLLKINGQGSQLLSPTNGFRCVIAGTAQP